MSRSRTAFTLVELLVVLAITAVLIALLLPALTKARQQVYRVTCMSNLRQVGMALNFYLDDSRGIFPPAPFLAYGQPAGVLLWTDYLRRYLGSKDAVILCPAELSITDNRNYSIYRYNANSLSPNLSVFPTRVRWNRRNTWQKKADVVFTFADFHEPITYAYTIHPPRGRAGPYAGLGITLTLRIVHWNEASTFTDQDWYVHWQPIPW